MVERPFGTYSQTAVFVSYEQWQTVPKSIMLFGVGHMKTRLLSGEGKVSSPSGYLSTVNYEIEIRGAGPIQGSIRVVSGSGGLSLYEHDDTLALHLDDGRLLTIVIKTPIDLTDDSWHILGSSSIRQP